MNQETIDMLNAMNANLEQANADLEEIVETLNKDVKNDWTATIINTITENEQEEGGRGR